MLGVLSAEKAVLQKFKFFFDFLLILESVIYTFFALAALHSDKIIL
jgi:hypothetical protein